VKPTVSLGHDRCALEVNPRAKVLSLNAAADRCVAWRQQGLEIVLANGAFDMLHVGHIRYLADARNHGDRLLVAVNSDASVHGSKGPLRPIIPEAERFELLSHLWMVDLIVLFDSETVTPILEKLRPEVHAKGTDYTVATVPEREFVTAYGGRTVICGDPKDHATTDLIGIILERFGTE
jgi:rfaE bifunctional protein nucleotidyltransferase chain/domain